MSRKSEIGDKIGNRGHSRKSGNRGQTTISKKRGKEEAVKEASKNVKISFYTLKKENIAVSADLSLTKGKVESIIVNVAEDKKEIASKLIQDIEERKRIAMFEMAE